MTENTAITLKHKVDSIEVVDKPTFDAAEALRATIRQAKKSALAPVAEEKAERHALWKKVCTVENDIKAEYDTVEKALKAKLFAYTEEQRKIAEAAARKAEEERQAAEAERIKEAEDLADEGHEEEAAALLDIPVEAPAPVASPFVPKVKGSRKYYSYEIADMAAFLMGCMRSEGDLSPSCIEDNATVLGAIVRAKKSFFKAPGVTLIVEER